MRARTILGAMLLVAATALVTSQVLSQDEKMSPQEEEMMQKWMQYATPGKHHEHLAWKAGNWDLVVKMWQTKDAPVMESPAKSTFKTIMDGRFLLDHTDGTFMDMPFEGMGLTGYDNLKRKYVAMWIDNMGTGVMTSEGSADSSGKVFTFKGEMADVMAGKMAAVRTVETITGDDTWKMEMFQPGMDGKEFKGMEITYTRKK